MHRTLGNRAGGANEQVQEKAYDWQSSSEEDAERLHQKRVGTEENVSRCVQHEKDDKKSAASEKELEEKHGRVSRKKRRSALEQR